MNDFINCLFFVVTKVFCNQRTSGVSSYNLNKSRALWPYIFKLVSSKVWCNGHPPVSNAAITLVLLLCVINIKAQEADSLDLPGSERYFIAMTSHSDGKQVKLRWAPSASRAWRHANKEGYRLQRYTIMRDNKLLSEEERSQSMRLNQALLKPWMNESDWVALAQRDSMAAIAAQALLGESFAISKGDSGLESFRDLLTEQENRFNFALFAADHSFETARALGLAYIDKDVLSNETYVYRVFVGEEKKIDTSIVPERVFTFPVHIDSGFTAIKISDVFSLPKVLDVEAEFSDRQALISWDAEKFSSFYVSYKIERSNDGVSWYDLNTLPLVHMFDAEALDNRMFWVDTLPRNEQIYFYRVLGRTVFDEYSVPSDPVYGMGLPAGPQYFPQITKVLENEFAQMMLSWTYPEEGESLIRGFKIMRSETDAGPVTLLTKEVLLSPDTRNFLDSMPSISNYYRVVAVDSLNREMSSFSAMAMLNDDEPPLPPLNVRGRILENGHVLISWDANTEADLMGYRVFRSFHLDEEFLLMSSAPVLRNFYVDSINLNTLNSELYIRVTALDYRYNTSGFSEPAVLFLPDTIPPASPAIKDFKTDTDGISLTWASSQSADVSGHEIQRRAVAESEWIVLQVYEGFPEQEIMHFSDTELEKRRPHEYRIRAIDQSGNESFSDTVQLARIDDYIRPEVENIQAQVDRRAKTIALSWTYQDAERVKAFEIYRWKEGAVPALIRAASPEYLFDEASKSTGRRAKRQTAQTFAWLDSSVKMNTKYQYGIKVIHQDGGRSAMASSSLISF